MIELEQRAAVVSEAMGWIGTPYHHRGRVKGAGVDCAQILILVYSACGLIEDFDPGHYAMDWMLHRDEERYLGWIKNYAHEVPHPEPGDIAMFKFGRCISHGAIVVGWPMIIHAYVREGAVCLGDASNGELATRVAGFYSIFKGE